MNQGREVGRPVQGEHAAVAVAPEALHQGVTVDPLKRRLARRIDIGHDHRVGVVETGTEVAEQIGQAGVAVRLDDRDHPTLGDRARRLQHRGDLDGVVAVVVDNAHAVRHARGRKAPPHPAEAG